MPLFTENPKVTAHSVLIRPPGAIPVWVSVWVKPVISEWAVCLAEFSAVSRPPLQGIVIVPWNSGIASLFWKKGSRQTVPRSAIRRQSIIRSNNLKPCHYASADSSEMGQHMRQCIAHPRAHLSAQVLFLLAVRAQRPVYH